MDWNELRQRLEADPIGTIALMIAMYEDYRTAAWLPPATLQWTVIEHRGTPWIPLKAMEKCLEAVADYNNFYAAHIINTLRKVEQRFDTIAWRYALAKETSHALYMSWTRESCEELKAEQIEEVLTILRRGMRADDCVYRPEAYNYGKGMFYLWWD
jgi:hypothetical protein